MSNDSRTKKIVAVILTIIIWGLGHVYVRRVKRGIGLFLLGLVIMFAASFVIPFPFSLIVGLGYLIWLISDVLKIINQQDSSPRQINSSHIDRTYCAKCGNPILQDSAFCIKCGNPVRNI